MSEDPWDAMPTGLAVALRLSRADQSADVIATALGIPVEGVAPLLEIAEAKFRRLGGDPAS